MVLSVALRGHDAGRAAQEPGESYHLTEDLADHAVNWVRTQRH